jgi:predicted molibdopterin-dependent oxidoreductase YjgC
MNPAASSGLATNSVPTALRSCEGEWVGIESRAGQTVLRATVTERVAPGVVYTTFHFPESGANMITTGSPHRCL